MSLRGIVWAFDQEIKPTHVKFVLVVYASFAIDNGVTYPHEQVVAKYTALSVECVRKAATTLVDSGLLIDTGKMVGNGHLRKVYQLPAAACDLVDPEEGKRLANPRRAHATLDDVIAHCLKLKLPRSDGEYFYNKWVGNGWRNNGSAIKDWRAVIRSWQAGGYCPSQKNAVTGVGQAPKASLASKFLDKELERQERLL